MDTSPSQLDIGILVLDVNFHCTTPPLEAQAWGCRRSLVQGLPGGHFYEVRDFDGPGGLVGPFL